MMQAYGFKEGDDLLEALLPLNLQLAEREKQGKAVIGACDPRQVIINLTPDREPAFS